MRSVIYKGVVPKTRFCRGDIVGWQRLTKDIVFDVDGSALLIQADWQHLYVSVGLVALAGLAGAGFQEHDIDTEGNSGIWGPPPPDWIGKVPGFVEVERGWWRRPKHAEDEGIRQMEKDEPKKEESEGDRLMKFFFGKP